MKFWTSAPDDPCECVLCGPYTPPNQHFYLSAIQNGEHKTLVVSESLIDGQRAAAARFKRLKLMFGAKR